MAAATRVHEKNQRLAPFEQRVLARHAPGTRTVRVAWRGGTTEVLELGEGPPVLLVHGGFGDAFHWAPILPALAEGRRVLAVHRPGHGLADPFDYRGVDILAHGRDFLGDVLDALALDRVDVVANSMGGLWSVAFAIENPHRVSRLVLVGAPAGTRSSAVPMVLRSMRIPVVGLAVRALMRRATRASTRDFWAGICVVHPECLDDDMLDATAASQVENLDSWWTFAARILDLGGLRSELVLGQRWERLTVPVRFVWGERDAFGPPDDGEAIAVRLRDARVYRIADAGHLPWLDRPDAVTAVLREVLDERQVGGSATSRPDPGMVTPTGFEPVLLE